jgi:hypothetical protein
MFKLNKKLPMARNNERYSWRNDWIDDGEDRRLSARPRVTEASSEECGEASKKVISGVRNRCEELIIAIERSKHPTEAKIIRLFPVRANPKEYLN